jgi:hypothetical protein
MTLRRLGNADVSTMHPIHPICFFRGAGSPQPQLGDQARYTSGADIKMKQRKKKNPNFFSRRYPGTFNV